MYLKKGVTTYHVAKYPKGLESNHVVTLSLSENGNNLNQITSSRTLFILKVSQICKNLDLCVYRSLTVEPSNKFCWMIWVIDSLISKLLVDTVGLMTLEKKHHEL